MKYFSLDHIAGMNCHYRYYTLEDFFASLQRRDITHAELWTCAAHYLLDEQGWQDAKALRRTARRYGIEVICLTPEQNNPKPHNLAARDPELIRRTYRYFSNAILAAEELECKLISVSAGWCFYSEPTADGWRRAALMLHELAEKARRHGVTLAMEPLLPSESRLVNTLAGERQMLQDVRSAGLKVNIDLGPVGAAGETTGQWFDAFGQDIVHCHFVDGRPTGHLAWGDGARDPEADLATFYQHGYQGYFTLELTSPDYFTEPWLADQKCLDTLSPWFTGTGKEGKA